MSIYDPTVGTGGMFTKSAHYISQQGGTVNAVEFYGYEIASDIWAICKMNMLAHGLEQAVINQRDILNDPPDFLGKFDIVLQNLPLPSETSHNGQTQRDNNTFLQHSIEAMFYYGRGGQVYTLSGLDTYLR